MSAESLTTLPLNYSGELGEAADLEEDKTNSFSVHGNSNNKGVYIAPPFCIGKF